MRNLLIRQVVKEDHVVPESKIDFYDFVKSNDSCFLDNRNANGWARDYDVYNTFKLELVR